MAKTTARIITVIIVLIILGVAFGIYQSRKDKKDTATPILSVTAFNQTKNTDATSGNSQPDDVIVFTLTAENPENELISGYIVEANIADIINTATLVDAQGASYNSATNSLVWTPLDIPGNGSIQKQFTVKVNPVSANTVMRIKFNNEIAVAVAKATIAGTNNPPPTAYVAPTAGGSSNVVLLLSLMTTVGYFAVRKYRTAASI